MHMRILFIFFSFHKDLYVLEIAYTSISLNAQDVQLSQSVGFLPAQFLH